VIHRPCILPGCKQPARVVSLSIALGWIGAPVREVVRCDGGHRRYEDERPIEVAAHLARREERRARQSARIACRQVPA
jgi:hypothetical protein